MGYAVNIEFALGLALFALNAATGIVMHNITDYKSR